MKLSSTYRAPLDFNFGLRYSYESGRPFGRLIIARGLGQGDVTMLAEARGSYALPAVNDFQVRIDKDFNVTSGQRLRLSVDVFNIFNSDTVLTLRNNSSQVTATTPWAQNLVDCPAQDGPVRAPVSVLSAVAESQQIGALF